MEVWRRSISNNSTFQVASLTSKGLSAVCTVGDTRQDKMEVDLIRNGQYQILFIGPELLLVNLAWSIDIKYLCMERHDLIRCNVYGVITRASQRQAGLSQAGLSQAGPPTGRLSANLSESDSSCTQQTTSSYHRPLALSLDMSF